jgi:hydrogenase nickel incorporation protein HypA/HybF
MHEYSIVQSLLERVSQEAAARGASSVTRLAVSVGELSGVEPELLATAYRTFRERTICSAAPLEIRRVPASWGCRRCDAEILPGAILRCLACDVPATLRAGDEILLDRIEMEVADV